MPFIDAGGRLFGRLNLIDALIVAGVVVGGLGVGFVKVGRTAVAPVVERSGPAEVDLLIRASLSDLGMFKEGEQTFVTVRNQPYDKVDIVKAVARRAQIAVPIKDGMAFRITEDPTTPYASEVLLTLRDVGQLTADGIVWGGQKMKVGVPIEVEGLKYRLRGSVLDVRMVGDATAAAPSSGAPVPAAGQDAGASR